LGCAAARARSRVTSGASGAPIVNLVQFGTIYNTLSRACDVRGEVVAETAPHGDTP